MSDAPLYIPFPRRLYDDLVRHARVDPAELAERQVRAWAERALIEDAAAFHDVEHARAFAEKHFPERAREVGRRAPAPFAVDPTEMKPLLWREIAVPHGAAVRMRANGGWAEAEVRNGLIADEEGAVSPNQWARKIANGAKRNAWRDLWFRSPSEERWTRARDLRVEALGVMRPGGTPFDDLEQPLE